MMLEAFDVSEDTWTTAQAPPGFAVSESPRYVGRGIAAIAADADRHRWNQASVTAGELATHYEITDLDGSQPDVWRYMADAETNPDIDPNQYR